MAKRHMSAHYVYVNGSKFKGGMPLRALFYGEGLFETFRYRGGLPVHFDRHYGRMKKGASVLGVPLPEQEYLESMAEEAAGDVGIDDAYMKICLLSDGRGPFYGSADRSTVLISLKPYTESPDSMSICASNIRRNSSSPLSRIKTLNYLDNILAKRQALDSGYDDALLLNERSYIAEGTASNVFWIKNGELFTPSVNTGLLPGITRSILIDLADELNIELREGAYGLEDLYGADAAFLTNSLMAICMVSSIDKHELDTNNPQVDIIDSRLKEALQW